MARTRFNPKRVKMHYSYAVEDIARLLKIHKNTARAWLKAGLETIDHHRPALVQGKVLRAFLEAKRTVNRRCCPPGTCYCMKCRMPRPPALGMVDFVPLTPTSGNFRGLCDECGTLMHRAGKLALADAIMPNLEIALAEPHARLIECSDPSLNSDSGRER